MQKNADSFNRKFSVDNDDQINNNGGGDMNNELADFDCNSRNNSFFGKREIRQELNQSMNNSDNGDTNFLDNQ